MEKSLRATQLEWIESVLKRRPGLTLNEWAGAANMASSTLYKFTGGVTETLRAKNIQRLAAAAGVPAPMSGGLGERDARAFEYAGAPDLGAIEPAGNSEFALEIKGDSLRAFGFEGGDILIFGAQEDADSGDIVCAQIIDHKRGGAETIIRVFQRPYLLSPTFEKPLAVDGDTTQIRGVLRRQVRIRHFDGPPA